MMGARHHVVPSTLHCWMKLLDGITIMIDGNQHQQRLTIVSHLAYVYSCSPLHPSGASQDQSPDPIWMAKWL